MDKNILYKYMSDGWHVFPVCWIDENKQCACGKHHSDNNIGKAPVTDHGLKDATVTKGGVDEYLRKYPNANWAGWFPQMLIIDVDLKHGGYESLEQLEAKIGKLPKTRTHLTGSGGLHIIYRQPEGYNIRNTVKLAGYSGIDRRGNGGYIVLPPSHHVFGENYAVVEDCPIIEAPKALLNLTQDATTNKAESILGNIKEGTRNYILASLAGSMRNRSLPQSVIETALREVNKSQCRPPLSDSEVQAIAKSISRYEPSADNRNGNGKKQDQSLKNQATTLKTVKMSTVQAEQVKFLWRPYIPLGKLTLIEGDPEAGKSWVTLAIATAVSLGRGLPEMELTEPRKVLLASAEDGKSDTIRPRLDALGANADMVEATDELFTLDDAGIERLENTVKVIKPLLLIIDPIMAYLDGEMDVNKANMVRHVTARLAKMAETYNIAVIAIRHLTKSSSTKTIYRGQGSIDFTASARSVLLAGIDPDNQERGFVHIKCNIAAHGKPVGYQITDDGRFLWTGSSEMTAARIFRVEIGDNALDKAKTFLRIQLADGEKLSNDVLLAANEQGVKERTLNTAKKKLGVKSRREGKKGSKDGKWFWSLGGESDV